ncbi:DUF2946 domain-containing protein [Pectobacterium atrosepticum]|uniref:DUF2946 domain-containing protein n=1 Tax=Pectobacterium versatile TaxID=2488639 RepID=A0AAW3RSZ3_9GAMM|nr:DUF2946 domain-containing protein [Pectobacterium versatile]MBD0847933.1 hypothetical protein [Pectobacterium carotovorum subsp. carotovorum]MCL6371398.1 DUF2946 domain-containing protein [Pectobacterium atrosepticum]MBA0159454.1 DUF2946 domain-containing protein [Pectobacterium versatile]MBA0170107.1 DUF2946 domain-containing protein [Pectobacterium versatile]MCH5084338.1 DUF2946 domain-containing protein [Pectobacterium versatile]
MGYVSELSGVSIKRVAAWLAIFSMMMLFIAPVISKSLVQLAACQVSTHHMPAASQHHHGAHEHEACHHGSTPHNLMMSSVGLSPMEDIACGYCQLLVHLPFILSVILPLLWLLLSAHRPTYSPDFVCPTLFRPYCPQRARAPPDAVSLF